MRELREPTQSAARAPTSKIVPNHHGRAPSAGCSFGVMPLIYLAPDELAAAESALVHRLLEDSENPNDWTVLALWASGGVYAVVLKCDGDVRAFTVGPEGDGYDVLEVS